MSTAVRSDVAFATESFEAIFTEGSQLLANHWVEIAHYKDIPLDIDVERYRAMEAAGMLRVFTARLEGRLIGYAVFVVNRNSHYRSSVQAVQDVLYVDPHERRGLTGLKLVKFADEVLRVEEVQVVYHHVKAKHPILGRLLGRLGYEVVDVIYAKRLD